MLSKNVIKVSLLSFVAFVSLVQAETAEELRAKYGEMDVETIDSEITRLEALIKAEESNIDSMKKNAVKNIFEKSRADFEALVKNCATTGCDSDSFTKAIATINSRMTHQGTKAVEIGNNITAMKSKKQTLSEIKTEKVTAEAANLKNITTNSTSENNN